jgi:DNA-binding NarL/FixJ family response regulator
MKPIRVLLVDDEPAIRQGLRMLFDLEPDLEVVGEAEDGLRAIPAAERIAPDVIVMDIEMAGGDGITATRLLTSSRPTSRVVVLSIHDSSTSEASSRAGAAAFVGKHEGSGRLVQVIRGLAAEREEDTS